MGKPPSIYLPLLGPALTDIQNRDGSRRDRKWIGTRVMMEEKTCVFGLGFGFGY